MLRRGGLSRLTIVISRNSVKVQNELLSLFNEIVPVFQQVFCFDVKYLMKRHRLILIIIHFCIEDKAFYNLLKLNNTFSLIIQCKK